MNAEYMMPGFLHVPNASVSRAAHVNLKRSQGVCLILEFLHIRSLRSSTLEHYLNSYNCQTLASFECVAPVISLRVSLLLFCRRQLQLGVQSVEHLWGENLWNGNVQTNSGTGVLLMIFYHNDRMESSFQINENQ